MSELNNLLKPAVKYFNRQKGGAVVHTVESNLISDDLQVSNLSDLVQISDSELRESLLRNGLLSNRIERIVRSYTAFRLHWISLSDSEKMSFCSNSYTSWDHSKWIERLERSRIQKSPRSPKTFDFGLGSLPSPIESASSSSKKKVDFATPTPGVRIARERKRDTH